MRLYPDSSFQFITIGNCGEVVTGSTPSKGNPAFWGGEIPFVTPAQLGFHLPITNANEYVTKEGAKRGRLLPEGSVLVCCIGSLGKTGVAGVPLISNQQINSIVFNQKKVDARYGYYAARCLMPLLEHFAPSTTIKIVKKSTFEQFEIPLPPLAEQKRIAAILDAADGMRAKRRESLAQLDTLLQSTFLDMFGDPEGSGWDMTTVEGMASQYKGAIRTGPFGSQLLHSEFVDEGISVLGIDNVVANEFCDGEPRFITAQKYEQLKRYTVKSGDVLITIMGTCGRCAIVPEDIGTAINTKHLCCITLDYNKCLPSFMHTYFLMHPTARRYLERSAKGAIMSGLNMGIIKALPIPIPPLDLQHRFATIVKSVGKQKAKLRQHLAELDALFASLQQRAFNGEL